MKIKRKIERIIPLLVMFIFIVTGCCILEKEEVYAASNKVVGDSNEAEVGQETEELDLEFLKTQYESIQQNRNLRNALQNESMQRGNASSNSWYGGAYIDKDGSLVVLVVEPDEEKINIIREYTQNDDICVEPCLYSYSDLIMVIDTLNANLNRLDAAGVCIQEMYEDIMRSRVIIRIDELTEEKESLVRSIIDKPCMLIENAIKVEMSEKETADVEEISNTLAESAISRSTVVLRGGDIISNNSTEKYSVLGFCAKKGSKKGYVVSGHAAQTLYNTFNTAGGVNIGYVSDTAFIDNSSADAAFISSSIYAETSNYLNVYVCTGVIEEVGDMPIGTTVCMYGGISGERKSGTIVSHYYTSKRKNINGDVINLLRQTTTTYEGVNGDSGSPVFILTGSSLVDALLVGIHSGHMETSEGYAIFSRYSNIVDELGVTAITK